MKYLSSNLDIKIIHQLMYIYHTISPEEYPNMTLTNMNILTSFISLAALIWLLPCVYLYISYETNIYHNECTHMVSPQCVFPGVLYNSCIGIISLHCVLFGVLPSILSGWYLCHRGYTDMSYHQSVFSHDIQN